MPQEPTRTARIEARIAPESLAMVKRAAELQGRSVSDFVVAAAQEAAHRAIEEAQIIRLSAEDQRMLAEALVNPPALAPAMERAIARHSTVIAEISVTAPFVVELLGSQHNRTGFRCGVEALDRYFREQVTQDIRRRLTNCFVAIDATGAVVGFYTFAATGLPMTELTSEQAKRLPRYPLLPAALIGRLAVAEPVRGQGLGSALIVDAITRAVRAEPAIYALIVDAKDDAARRFYLHLGFQAFMSRPLSLFLPIAEAIRRLAAMH